MQDNLKLVIWTLAGLVAAWFIVMAVNRNIFLHTDVDRSLTGVVSIAKTDIGTQCGEEYVNTNSLIEYKLNSSNQIVYLCPQGFSPIQKTVTAGNIGDDFRAQINPLLREKLNRNYPAADKTPAASNPTIAPVQTQEPAVTQPSASESAPQDQGALDAPAPIQPAREKGLFATPAAPAPQQAAPAPAAKPAAPDNANPFLGNPAPAPAAQ